MHPFDLPLNVCAAHCQLLSRPQSPSDPHHMSDVLATVSTVNRHSLHPAH